MGWGGWRCVGWGGWRCEGGGEVDEVGAEG